MKAEAGDKVRVKVGAHAGERGVIETVDGDKLGVRLEKAPVTLRVHVDQVTNFSLAARKAWVTGPDRGVGRRKGTKIRDRVTVTFRIDRDLWEEFMRLVEAGRIEDHALHAEWASLDPGAADRLCRVKSEGGRIVAVGTTSARTLETAARGGTIESFEGETALYIRPGHAFRAVDALLTNFHLPRSSLLVLVAALTGYDLMRRAYAEAIRERYRFYSYGDAMLIL